MRRLVAPAALAAVLGLLLAGCGSNASVSVGAGPASDPAFAPLVCALDPDRPSGGLMLLAQAVPAASRLPCVRSRPGGWSVDEFEARDGRARLALTRGQSQDGTLTVDLVRRCDPGVATGSVSDRPGLRRYDRVSRARSGYAADRYYVEPGACTAFHFRGGGPLAAQTAASILGVFDFLDRAVLDRAVRRFTDGRLHLDPERRS